MTQLLVHMLGSPLDLLLGTLVVVETGLDHNERRVDSDNLRDPRRELLPSTGAANDVAGAAGRIQHGTPVHGGSRDVRIVVADMRQSDTLRVRVAQKDRRRP